MNLDTCELYMAMVTLGSKKMDRQVSEHIVKDRFEAMREDPEAAFFSLALLIVDPEFEEYRTLIAMLAGVALAKASELPKAQQSIGRIFAKWKTRGVPT